MDVTQSHLHVTDTELDKLSLAKALRRLYALLNMDRAEIVNVYIYAIASGFILLSLPLGIQAITNLLFGVTFSTSLAVLIGVVVLGVLINGILQIYQMQATERIQQRIFARLTFAYAYRLPRINLLSVDQYYLPELVNRFFDTASLQKGLSKLLIDFPAASIQVIFGLILLSFYHPVFIVFALILIILLIFIFYVTSPRGFKTSMRESDYKYGVAHWLEEISRSIKTFKFSQSNEFHLFKTDNLVSGYLHSRIAHFSVLIFQYKALVFFKVMVTAAMLIIGSVLFVRQQINLGQFIASEIIIITVLTSVEKMIVSLEVVYDVLTSHEKLNKVLDKPNDHDELAQMALPEKPEGMDVKINNLQFAYPGKRPVLKDIHLHIRPGQKVCIKGSEGSGKSTLIRVLMGIYPDYEGNLLFDDIPQQMIMKSSLHAHVSAYLANEELFSGTLFENLAVGNNAIEANEINAIGRITGLYKLIQTLPNGLQTIIDPQGKKLSHSYVQKILLTRSLVSKPSLLLLEDNFTVMEKTQRDQIIEYLTSASNPVTLIAVSNEEDFAGRCSLVLMMDDGKLTEYHT